MPPPFITRENSGICGRRSRPILPGTPISISLSWKIHGRLKASRSCSAIQSMTGNAGVFGSTKVRPSWFTATSCLSAIPPAPPMRTTAWDYCGLTSTPIRSTRKTGTSHRALSLPPVTKTASTDRDTTALRKRRKVKMCWCTTQEITPKLRAIRCTTQTATLV